MSNGHHHHFPTISLLSLFLHTHTHSEASTSIQTWHFMSLYRSYYILLPGSRSTSIQEVTNLCPSRSFFHRHFSRHVHSLASLAQALPPQAPRASHTDYSNGFLSGSPFHLTIPILPRIMTKSHS